MKIKSLLLLSALSVIAFISCGKKDETKGETKKTNEIETTSNAGLKIVFINTDTLSSNYEYFKDVAIEMGKMEEEMMKELEGKKNAAMNRSRALQQNFDLKTRSDQEKAAREIQMLEQNYARAEQEAMGRLSQLRDSKLIEANKKLDDFLKVYCKENKIDFVLKNGITGSTFYADEKHDITKIVLDAMNKDYNAGKSK